MNNEIKAGSKLLAEFEGLPARPNPETSYHTDYNELHRVWRKFRDLQGFSPIEKDIHKSLCDNAAIHLTYGNTPELMFLSLIDGVKWYYSLKPKS